MIQSVEIGRASAICELETRISNGLVNGLVSYHLRTFALYSHTSYLAIHLFVYQNCEYVQNTAAINENKSYSAVVNLSQSVDRYHTKYCMINSTKLVATDSIPIAIFRWRARQCVLGYS